MTNPNRFSTSRFSDDDTLHITWLPDRHDAVLIGFTSSLPENCVAGYLQCAQVPLLTEYLFLMKQGAKGAAMRFAIADDLTLIVRPSNRGDPYEEGVQIEIDRGDYNSISTFIPERQIDALIEAVAWGMPPELPAGATS